MNLKRLVQLNSAIDSYFTEDELDYINRMVHSYQRLIDIDPAYDADDYISELFLYLIELKRKELPGEIRSRAAYYLINIKRLMLTRARRRQTQKKVEDTVLELQNISTVNSGKKGHLDNLDSFVKFLLDEGEDELFYILLLTISSILNDKESEKDKLNISKISANLPIHYLKYRRHIEKIRGLYAQT